MELFVDLRRRRRGGRSIAFTETLAASPIPPLDKTGSQVIAPAITADQFLQLRLASRLLRERPCGLGLIPDSPVRGRCCGGSDRLALAFLGQFCGFHFALISLSRWARRDVCSCRRVKRVVSRDFP